MPKIAKPLGALAVRDLKRKLEQEVKEGERKTIEGLHAVGTVSGLHLSISASGARSWILRTKIGTRRSDIGLGAYPAVSLALAHKKAQATKESIKQGIDPVAARTRSRSTVEWTFERCALEYIKLHRASWKGADTDRTGVEKFMLSPCCLYRPASIQSCTQGLVENHETQNNRTLCPEAQVSLEIMCGGTSYAYQ